jgi:putative IMPACT (imprinted ancient) family translation regulator
VVVTRYFGGTKLGTGGLVKAYGDAVREILPLVKLAELVETVTLAFTIPYNLYELCVRLIENNNGIILDKVFAVEVDLLVQFKVENEDSFRTDLVELCKGQVEIVEIERNPESVFPVS